MLLSIQKVKEIYAICRRILINWEKEGLITPLRTPLLYIFCSKDLWAKRC